MTDNDSNKLQAIIVDDEALARQGLEMRLSEFDKVEIVKSCANASEALKAIAEIEPDLVQLWGSVVPLTLLLTLLLF